MNGCSATNRALASVSAQQVPEAQREVHAEIGRLHRAVDRLVANREALSGRLAFTRIDAPTAADKGSAEASPCSKLGSDLRGIADRIEAEADVLAYEVTSLAL
jgi:hypothetical protein